MTTCTQVINSMSKLLKNKYFWKKKVKMIYTGIYIYKTHNAHLSQFTLHETW